MRKTILLTALIVVGWSCSSPDGTKNALGEVTFKVTGSEEANAHFIKGHLLMHSFEYDDAAEAFRQARLADPSCAMAYWGEAMTYNHPIWQQQDYEKGKAILAGLDSTRRDDLTELEKDLLQAAKVLYGEGTKPERDKAYAQFMGTLYEKYPGNHEVASLYALSLLGSVPVGRNEDVFRQSAKISENILKENPNHPGALHYLIHADDDPAHAKEALFAANEYALVAPDASHALHMPTHIFVALGMWDKVIALNEQSWQSSLQRKQNKKLTNDDLGYHSFYWLEYGYLQKERNDDARRLLDQMKKYREELPSSRARVHEVVMRSTYFVETKDWPAALISDTTNVSDLGAYIRARELYFRGMRSFYNGDDDELEKSIVRINAIRVTESATINADGIAVCKSGALSPSGTTQLDIDEILVMESQLEGMRSWAKKDYDDAERSFKKAAELESGTSYSFGPPSIAKPSAELYGEFLLERDRPAEAMESFDAALKRAPKRRLSLEGKIMAAKKLNLEKEVKEMEKELTKVEPSDISIPG